MYKHVPYNAGAVDHPGKESGPPQAWDMDVPPPSLFEKSTYKVEIPKTSSIQVRIVFMESCLVSILCLVMFEQLLPFEVFLFCHNEVFQEILPDQADDRIRK